MSKSNMVSVCMATLNGSQFLREQIESILPQLNIEDELIISDDGSDDSTIAILKSYADSDTRVKVHINRKRRGIAFNFEHCLKFCKGEYIFLADQDDVWMQSKIQVMKDYLDRYDLVICDCGVANHQLQLTHHSFFQLNGSRAGFLRNVIRNSYMGCCMGFKRNVLEKALPFPRHLTLHDIWIGLIGELHFTVCFIPERLVYHRRHSANASTTSQQSRATVISKFLSRYKIMVDLLFHKSYAG
jgi:glycosyltransferase involved in cell wall biosynthesis